MNEINGTYGGSKTPCIIFFDDAGWYCVEASRNVNRCDVELLIEGVDVEGLPDVDTMPASSDIDSADELERFINDDELNTPEEIAESWTNGQKAQAFEQWQNSGLDAFELVKEFEGYLSSEDIQKLTTNFLNQS